MSKLLAMLVTLLVGAVLSACTSTQNLSTEMQKLSTNYKIFESSTDHKEAFTALKNMQAATLASQKKRPVSLSQETDFKEYQALYTQLNAEIIQAQTLTQAGQLDQAKQHLKNIDTIKKAGHQAYKP